MRYLLLIVLLVATMISAGCIQSHSMELNNVHSHFDSGTSRITPLVTINFTSANVEGIRVNVAAAKGNFSEAMDILEKIPLKDLSNKDQTNLKAMKTLIHSNIKISDLLEFNFSDITQQYQSSINAPKTCSWSSANSYSYEINDPFVNNISEMKSKLLSIKSDIAAIEISTNEDFNKSNYSDLSPTVLRIYNETGNRLINFNNNIDDSITILENSQGLKTKSKLLLRFFKFFI